METPKISEFEARRQEFLKRGAEGKLAHGDQESIIENSHSKTPDLVCTITEQDGKPVVFEEGFVAIGFNHHEGSCATTLIANCSLPDLIRAHKTFTDKLYETLEQAPLDEQLSVMPLLLESMMSEFTKRKLDKKLHGNPLLNLFGL